MSNEEREPTETVCEAADQDTDVQVLTARDVPLGGPRAMTVRRTLPHKNVRMIGAWCFLDHYGPDDVASTGGMAVPRHPHTGLSTVSWLFTGEIDHLDSAGNSATVLPGEVNLMTAGRGISHSEFTAEPTTILHGAQLWLAAPEATRHDAPRFDHYRPDDVAVDGGSVKVFLGSWLGSTSPIDYPTPVLGAEVLLEPNSQWTAPADPGFEYGVLLDTGSVQVAGHEVPEHGLAYLGTGRDGFEVRAGDDGARLVIIGGVPFDEKIVMWWNFIGRSHDEIVEYRARWQGEIGAEDHDHDTEYYGPFPDDTPAPLPAPVLPNARLVSRN